MPRRLSLDAFRHRLSSAEALPQLALLAIVVGLVTGCVILTFRLAIDGILGALLPSGDPEDFESLGPLTRSLLPVIGMAVLGAAVFRLPSENLRFGVAHVIERLSRHQGYLTLRNALVQFFGGILALVAGISGGREGPAIHLGAASASLLGQSFELPNNAIRILVACGVAAAIAGSFNTPMAGVIFAMEVVMMQYTIGSFIPVILAAVTATLMTHYEIGPEPAFNVAALHFATLHELPYVVLGGVLIGALAAGYIQLVQLFARLHTRSFWQRALLAGIVTGASAVAVPEVMGVGYDTVNAAMAGTLTLAALAGVVLLKFLSSAAAIGLGMPVGVIGPTFVIGAATGGLLGAILHGSDPGNTSFYVTLGMAAMMSAVLQAPLAALMAVLELTANPNVILPAMLIIVVATMVTSVVFGQRSVFLSTLRTLGLQYPPDPVTAHLQRAGVSSIMNRNFTRLRTSCSVRDARQALTNRPRWVLVESAEGRSRSVLNASDLRAYVEDLGDADEREDVRLLEIPGTRRDVTDIDYRSTVDEAQEKLRSPDVEALCVRRTTAPMITPVRGIIIQEDIDNYRESAL